MISIVACCRSAKLCAHTTQDFWSQQYLTLEMVPLSLFSCKLNKVEKLELVDCLLALNMINSCTVRGLKTWIRYVCCSKVLATLLKFRTSGGTRQKKHPSLHQPRNKKMFQVLWRRRNLVTIVSCWWLSIFLLSSRSLEVLPVV